MMSSPLSVRRGLACREVVGVGSLLTAQRVVPDVPVEEDLKWNENTSSPSSMSFQNAAVLTRLIGGGACRWKGKALNSSGKW